MRAFIVIATIFFISLVQMPAALAFETDQYNLPSTPLADIGGEVSEYSEENIRKAIDKINSEIIEQQACADRVRKTSSKCASETSVRTRLAYLRSDEAVAREVYNRLGYGIIAFARAATWMDSHKFRSQPARYKTTYRRSIFVSIPTDYFTISPTVNMYGKSFGTDKIAHFFQQGYTYYRIFSRAVAKGSSTDEAVKKAVRWGQMTERTYYGTLVGGVFSNADLYANYAGLKFYQGLTKPLTIGGLARPATLILKNGIWVFNESANIGQTLLRPFISDHLNEALNPSVFVPGLRSSIRGIVRKQSCPQWRALYPDRTKDDFERTTDSLSLWNDEDYGFKKSGKSITIANTCFGAGPSSMPKHFEAFQ